MSLKSIMPDNGSRIHKTLHCLVLFIWYILKKGRLDLQKPKQQFQLIFSIIISLHIEKEERCIFLDHKIDKVHNRKLRQHETASKENKTIPNPFTDSQWKIYWISLQAFLDAQYEVLHIWFSIIRMVENHCCRAFS